MISPQLLTKLDQLFAQREINTYAQHVGLSENTAKEILNILKNLQVIIYEVDQLLEDNRVLDIHQRDYIAQRWEEIQNIVTSIVQDRQHADHLLKRLRAFFQMEMQMREGVSPSTIPLDAFYALKICDIHLQRDLINHASQKTIPSQIWYALEQYDKLGEVIDDLEDIAEDVDAINSNRFLIEAFETDLIETKEKYSDFIDLLVSRIVPFESKIIELIGAKAQHPTLLATQAKTLLANAKLPNKTPHVVSCLSQTSF